MFGRITKKGQRLTKMDFLVKIIRIVVTPNNHQILFSHLEQYLPSFSQMNKINIRNNTCLV